MKVKRVLPCICISHKPNAGDQTYYGMPILTVTEDGRFWGIQCPACGRAGFGLHQYKSQYFALKAWNELQIGLWNSKCRDFWEDKPKEGCPEWRQEMYQEMMEDSL